MEIGFILIGLMVGAALGWFIAQARSAALAERARLQAADLETTRARLLEIENLKSKIENDLAAERAAATEKISALTEAHDRLTTSFKALSADALRSNNLSFLELARESFGKLHQQSADELGKRQQAIDSMVKPLKQQLTDFRTRIDAIYKTEGDERVSLKNQIEQLRQLNVRITEEAHSLSTALKGQAQVRGAWGELVLERLLEGCGLRKGEDYLVQKSLIDQDDKRSRPDIILRLPDQRHLVIDSKVSLVAYEQAANATDQAQQEVAKKAHANAVKKHVQELAEKKYEDSGSLFSPEYVFMFIPIEPAFAMALEAEAALYDWAFDRRVILVTSSGLLAALRTVATIWKQDRQTKNVQEIAKRGGLLYDKFAGLYSDLEIIGNHLNKARESYDEVLGKLKTGRGNLLSQVEELKTLGAKAQKSLPTADPTEN